LYFGLLGSTDEASRVTMFEAAMGPHIGGSIVAVQHDLKSNGPSPNFASPLKGDIRRPGWTGS
jgi:hypothetical protein